jgi:hypothetical protein
MTERLLRARGVASRLAAVPELERGCDGLPVPAESARLSAGLTATTRRIDGFRRADMAANFDMANLVPVDSVAKRITLVHVRPEITHCIVRSCPVRRCIRRRLAVAKKTIRVSDISGQEIADGKGATVRITFADARKGARELDVTDAEAEGLGGRSVARRGRRPKTAA